MKLISPLSILSKISTRNLSSKFNPRFIFFRSQTLTFFKFSEWHIVNLKNDVVAAWHPQKQFPYEYTQAIDLGAVAKEKQVSKSIPRLISIKQKEISGY